MSQKLNVAVDLGGTRVRVALTDSDLRLVRRIEESTILERGPAGTIEQILRMLDSIGGEDLRTGRLRAMGVATPGPLDIRTGMVYSPPNMPDWHDVPLQALLQDATGLPVKIENDANTAALGEYLLGAGRGTRNLVYLTVSTGIGGGVIVEGTLLEGTSGTAAELGHMTIDRHGPLCPCGNIGCLEILASGTSIARRFNEALTSGKRSALPASLGGRRVTAADVARGAAEGDPLAVAVWQDAMEALGFGVVNCIHVFNPDVVALGGGVTQSGSLLFAPVRRIVDLHAMPLHREVVRVVATELGEDVGLIGAAALTREV